MSQPPDPGPGPGDQPGRDPGLPGLAPVDNPSGRTYTQGPARYPA